MKKCLLLSLFSMLLFSMLCFGQSKNDDPKYKLLATTRTSTMQKELDKFSAKGYRILVGSPASNLEMAVFMLKQDDLEEPYQYKLLATRRTGTMQKELKQAAAKGFRLLPQTMIAKEMVFGGREIVVILEKSPKSTRTYEYKLLATTRTSTLQKEVTEAEREGFAIVGMVSRSEHMIIMERRINSKPIE